MIESKPIALIGSIWGKDQHPSHYITDIAVAPSKRGQGLSSMALQQVMAWPGHPPTAKWTAFVNPRNLRAQSVLRKSLWKEVGVSDGMTRFEKSIMPLENDCFPSGDPKAVNHPLAAPRATTPFRSLALSS